MPNQAANNLTIGETGAFAVGDTYAIVVNPAGKTGATLTCSDQNDIAFNNSPVPTAVATAAGTPSAATVVPTFTVALGEEPGLVPACGSSTVSPLLNELNITVATPGTLGSATGWTITIAGIKYNVGGAATAGGVSLADSSFQSVTAHAPVAFASTPSNATVGGLNTDVIVGSNTPPVGLATGTAAAAGSLTNAAISPITFKETAVGAVPGGGSGATQEVVAVELAPGNSFDPATASLPIVTVSAGSGATANDVQVFPATASAGGFLTFNVTAPSTTAPATYTLSNLHVDSQSTPGPVTFTASDGIAAVPASVTTLNTAGLAAFTVLGSTRTSGTDADATAIDEFQAAYPAGNNVAVLADDANYPDALSASYLAGELNTGILLTPTAALSTETANAIRLNGVDTVYIVGGVQSVSAAVASTLAATTATADGGAALTPAAKINVITIAGATEYDTSSMIAQYFQKANVGTGTFNGAFGGKYDDVTADSAAAGAYSATGPVSGSGKTAILATGAGFEDATASSVIGFSSHFPVILTTGNALSAQAASALSAESITQVIVAGGPASVSDVVTGTLIGEGISVLRVAGNDYTDTAQELAQFELNSLSTTGTSPQPEGLGWDVASGNQVTLAVGDGYQDALAGAPFAGRGGPNETGHPQPILLTFDPNTLGTFLSGFLAKAGSTAGLFGGDTHSHVYTINVAGGPLSVSQATVTAALALLAAG
ncbi:MAG TPA: cell wall-binding repeat-containing protein [Acidimicrobiales bacterium]|nr:cell wall-binding repeat-containing protein [Acidimicrobiales bacterium]